MKATILLASALALGGCVEMDRENWHQSCAKACVGHGGFDRSNYGNRCTCLPAVCPEVRP